MKPKVVQADSTTVKIGRERQRGQRKIAWGGVDGALHRAVAINFRPLRLNSIAPLPGHSRKFVLGGRSRRVNWKLGDFAACLTVRGIVWSNLQHSQRVGV
jgi:hypothetical protein